MKRMIPILCLAFVSGTAHAELSIVALHPIIADLARQVGGPFVSVDSLIDLDRDSHDFDPTPSHLALAAKARLVLASGKHLEESWIAKVKDNLADGIEVFEVGRRIPSLLIDTKNDLFLCCPKHAEGSLDPHWWHSVSGMQRAARILGDLFGTQDPANKAAYKAQSRAYSEQLDTLTSWAKKEIAQIPRADRELSTSHLAFGYFCKEFGFKAVPVLGLNKEQDPSPAHLAETIEILRKYQVKAVFPEVQANPKALTTIAAEAGITVGKPLMADSLTQAHPTYIDMMRYNISTIVEALK
ncbi:MAG: zinc/manganese transport system substrate-binding protein [Candidatus Omnitrophota bacterium]|jgi:zinc/manganese transport system substrate-binding protein